MLLDKRRVGLITKVGAVVVALAFIISYIPFMTSLTKPTNSQQAKVTQTITALEQAAKKNPKSASAWIQLGNAYYDANIWDKAVESYRKGLQLEPKNVPARVDMSIAYYGMGQIETATVEAREATKIDPKFGPAYYNLGVFLSSQGKNKEALQAYKKYVELEPQGEKVNEAKAQIAVLQKAKAEEPPVSVNANTPSSASTPGIQVETADGANVKVETKGEGGVITIGDNKDTKKK